LALAAVRSLQVGLQAEDLLAFGLGCIERLVALVALLVGRLLSAATAMGRQWIARLDALLVAMQRPVEAQVRCRSTGSTWTSGLSCGRAARIQA